MLLERGGKVRVPAMGFSAAWRRCHGVLKYLNGERKLHRRRVTQHCSRICVQSGRGVRGGRFSGAC